MITRNFKREQIFVIIIYTHTCVCWKWLILVYFQSISEYQLWKTGETENISAHLLYAACNSLSLCSVDFSVHAIFENSQEMIQSFKMNRNNWLWSMLVLSPQSTSRVTLHTYPNVSSIFQNCLQIALPGLGALSHIS